MKMITSGNFVMTIEAGEDDGDAELHAKAMGAYTAKITAELEVAEIPEALDIGIKVMKLATFEIRHSFLILHDLGLSAEAFDIVVEAINTAWDSEHPGQRLAFAWPRPARPIGDRTMNSIRDHHDAGRSRSVGD